MQNSWSFSVKRGPGRIIYDVNAYFTTEIISAKHLGEDRLS